MCQTYKIVMYKSILQITIFCGRTEQRSAVHMTAMNPVP